MRKLTIDAPDNQARLVKLASGEWYIQWYADGTRFRQKFGLNRIKDLTERQRQADAIIHQINAAGSPPSAELPAATLLTAVKLPQSISFNAFVDQYIELRHRLLAPATLKAIRVHRNKVNEYAVDHLKQAEMNWDGFGGDFILRYFDWAFQSPRDWSKNYAIKSVKTLKYLLKLAQKKKLTAIDIDTDETSIKYIETDHIALNTEDIEKLLHVELDGLLSDVRFIFLFACLTGLRFSDFSRLTTANLDTITGKNGKIIPVVKVFTQKTGEKVVVPLNNIAQAIIKRHGGRLPDVPCNQVFNRYVKEACELADVTESVILKKNVSGRNISKQMPKHQAVSSHTARRTFATIAYRELKMPIALIMKITGHRTETEFFKYLKIGKEEAALEMSNYL